MNDRITDVDWADASPLLPVALDASPLRRTPTGVGRYVEQLLRHAPPGEVEWTLMTNRPSEVKVTAQARVASGWAMRPTVAWLQLVAPALIARSGAAVAHFTTGRAALRCPIPFVLTVHDLTVLEQPELYPLRERLLTAPWLAASIPRAAAVIAVSQATATAIRRRFPAVRDRIHVIYEAAAAEFSQPVDLDYVEFVRARYVLGQRVWLVVGSITTRKNLPRLVEAFAAAARQLPGEPAQLVLAGPAGCATPAVRTRIDALGVAKHVQLLGIVPAEHIPALYSAAEIVIVPSLHEGFGLPVVEALAMGRTVLATRRGAIPEVAGDAAWLVEPEVDALTAGLLRLASDPALRHALEARAATRASHFSWHRAAADTLALYHRVAALTPNPLSRGTGEGA